MNHRVWARRAVLLTAPLLVAGLVGCGPPRLVQDWMDRRQLKRHFGIPDGASLLEYDGYPAMVGFGQREGLTISAVYHLTDEQEAQFVESSRSRGWDSLPIPEQERETMGRYVRDVPVDLENGIYLALTAGDNVLWARRTRPVAEVGVRGDLIFGVMDTDSNELHVVVTARY